MRLMPVTLRMEKIEPDSWATITFETPNVGWSIGNEGRDSLGFSCGGKDLLRVEESRFQSLEIIGSSLVLRTPRDFSQTPFVLTLFVVMPDHVGMLEAHCDMNDDACVYVELENFKRQIWKSGRVSAKVPPVLNDITKVSLRISGAKLGKMIRVSLESETPGEMMYWSFGPNAVSHDLEQEVAQRMMAASVRSEDGTSLPLCGLMIDASVIEIELADSAAGSGYGTPDILVVEAYVHCILSDTGRAGRLLLKADCDNDICVTAQCGYQRPQYLTAVYKPFEF